MQIIGYWMPAKKSLQNETNPSMASLHSILYVCSLLSSALLYGTHIWVSTICITISLTPNLLLEERKVCVCIESARAGGLIYEFHEGKSAKIEH